MDFAAILVMILVLLALVGVLVFLVWDYLNFKTDIKKTITQSTDVVAREKNERLSNIKYVVDQVNTVNTDIYNTFSSNVVTQQYALSNLQATNSSLIRGLDTVFAFENDSQRMSLLNLPGGVNPDLNLMAHVNAISGMDIMELSSNISTKFCSESDPSRCIEFPDASGNTFLTSLYPNGKVVIDGEALFRNKVTYASVNQGAVTTYADISTMGTNDTLFKSQKHLMIQSATGNVGIGRTPVNPPNAMLHINAPDQSQLDIFSATSSASANTPVKITNDGTLVVNKIQLGSDATAIQIRRDPANQRLVINSPQGITIATTDPNNTRFTNKVDFAVLPTMPTPPVVGGATSTATGSTSTQSSGAATTTSTTGATSTQSTGAATTTSTTGATSTGSSSTTSTPASTLPGVPI